MERYENTINHCRKPHGNHARNPDLDNAMTIVCKYKSKDNSKHFDYPSRVLKACNYNKGAMTAANIFRKSRH